MKKKSASELSSETRVKIRIRLFFFKHARLLLVFP